MSKTIKELYDSNPADLPIDIGSTFLELHQENLTAGTKSTGLKYSDHFSSIAGKVGPLIETSDANTLTSNGVYLLSNTSSNIPLAAVGVLLVTAARSTGDTNNRIMQQFTDYTTGKTYTRAYNGSTWTTWNNLIGLNNPELIINTIYPVGSFYVQYPNAASNTDSTEFPVAYRPATLFGGTWTEQWSSESIGFITRGTLSDEDRVNGFQTDALQVHRHDIIETSSGASENGSRYIQAKYSLQDSNDISKISDPTLARTASVTRIRNRRIKVWKRTA